VYYNADIFIKPVPMAARSKARTVFDLSKTWDRELESRSGHGCVSAFFCVVLSGVGGGVALG